MGTTKQIIISDQVVDMHLTGGETTDAGYLVRTIIVDSTITARMNITGV